MFKRNLTAAAVALAFAGPVPAQDVDLAKIREEMKQMKEADAIASSCDKSVSATAGWPAQPPVNSVPSMACRSHNFDCDVRPSLSWPWAAPALS